MFNTWLLESEVSVTRFVWVNADPFFSQVIVGVVGSDLVEQLRVAELPTTTFLNVGLVSNSEIEKMS